MKVAGEDEVRLATSVNSIVHEAHRLVAVDADEALARALIVEDEDAARIERIRTITRDISEGKCACFESALESEQGALALGVVAP